MTNEPPTKMQMAATVKMARGRFDEIKAHINTAMSELRDVELALEDGEYDGRTQTSPKK